VICVNIYIYDYPQGVDNVDKLSTISVDNLYSSIFQNRNVDNFWMHLLQTLDFCTYWQSYPHFLPVYPPSPFGNWGKIRTTGEKSSERYPQDVEMWISYPQFLWISPIFKYANL